MSSPRANSRSRAALLILLIAAIAGGSLRVAVSQTKRTINHDEGISYLCAAGNQGRYDELQRDLAPPLATWTSAAQVKQLLKPDGAFAFTRIRDDLARTDIHPPLYFWLLHVWVLAFGVTTATGPLLNTVIALAAMLALFGLTRFVLRDAFMAAIVAGVWFLSPAAIATCYEARHYDLLALCTIAFTWAALRCADTSQPLKKQHLAALALTTAAGALTHYHFALIAAAIGALLLARTIHRRVPLAACPPVTHAGCHADGRLRRHASRPAHRFLPICAAICVGVVLFIAAHPQFYVSLLKGRGQAQPFDIADLIPRLKAVLTGYSTFFLNTPYNEWIVHKYFPLFAVAAGASIVALIALARYLRPAPTNRPARILLYLFATMAAANLTLYLTAVSPRHAMDPAYLAMVWPFLACILVVAIQHFRRLRTAAAFTLFVGMLAAGTGSVHWYAARWNTRPDPGRFLRNAPCVIIDNVARGVLPSVVWHIPNDTPIFAAPQDRLLEHTDEWTTRLQPGTVYVSELAYGGTKANREEILTWLSTVGEATFADGGVWRRGRVWVVREDALAK